MWRRVSYRVSAVPYSVTNRTDEEYRERSEHLRRSVGYATQVVPISLGEGHGRRQRSYRQEGEQEPLDEYRHAGEVVSDNSKRPLTQKSSAPQSYLPPLPLRWRGMFTDGSQLCSSLMR
jgi:hypothetical protein